MWARGTRRSTWRSRSGGFGTATSPETAERGGAQLGKQRGGRRPHENVPRRGRAERHGRRSRRGRRLRLSRRARAKGLLLSAQPLERRLAGGRAEEPGGGGG